MDYTIEYYSEEVQEQILALPNTLAARYVVLTRRMTAIGANLGPPHTESFGDGLFELRLKGAEGIASGFLLHVDRPPHHDAALVHQEDPEDATEGDRSRTQAYERGQTCELMIK